MKNGIGCVIYISDYTLNWKYRDNIYSSIGPIINIKLYKLDNIKYNIGNDDNIIYYTSRKCKNKYMLLYQQKNEIQSMHYVIISAGLLGITGVDCCVNAT